MRTSKLIFSVIVSACLFLLAGCMDTNQPLNRVLQGNDTMQKTNQPTVKQFQETTNPDGPTAVESAIELSKKYAAMSEELSRVKLEKQNMNADNDQLTQQVAALKKELAQTQKELSEANDLLVEMRIELNNWKTDVLGFRDEMRQADKVQLKTLMKILKVLGGEIPDNTASEQEVKQ